MCKACCVDGHKSCLWCCFQFIPCTSPCTQYCLRSKVLDGDMKKYSCFQGQFSFCCGTIAAGKCSESSCPELCLCCESTCCNGAAVSASRMTVMDQYDLRSDPCDNRLLRFSNCLQWLSCICWVLAFIDGTFEECARIIDLIADIVYHTISGCMTAQVAYEIDYQKAQGNQGDAAYANATGLK